MNRKITVAEWFGMPSRSVNFTIEGTVFMLVSKYSIYEDAWFCTLYKRGDLGIFEQIKQAEAEYIFELLLDKDVDDEAIYLYMKLNNLV